MTTSEAADRIGLSWLFLFKQMCTEANAGIEIPTVTARQLVMAPTPITLRSLLQQKEAA